MAWLVRMTLILVRLRISVGVILSYFYDNWGVYNYLLVVNLLLD